MSSFSLILHNKEDPIISRIGNTPELIMDCKFDTNYDTLYTSHVDGRILKIKYDFDGSCLISVSELYKRKGSCRNIELRNNKSIAGYNTGEIVFLNSNWKEEWKCINRNSAINSLKWISDNIIVNGDDNGYVYIWDTREKPKNPSISFKDYDDCINDICLSYTKQNLLVACGDTLGIYDLRSICKNKKKDHLVSLSDAQEENILCISLFRNNQNVVCGTDEGNLLLFTWDNFGDCSDRITIPFVDGFHGDNSVESLAMLDEQTSIIATSDGNLKIVEFFPNKIIGFLKHIRYKQKCDVSNLECSKVAISREKNIIACSHGTVIDIFDMKLVDNMISSEPRDKKKKKKDIDGFFVDL
ncbi:hypothetical protein ACR3K2_20510 [Cryptosporidium serpentis]